MKTKRILTTGASLVVAALALAGCSSGNSEAAAGAQTDSGGKITVWVDPPRVPAAEAFQEAYPDIEIDVVQIDGTVGGKTVKQSFANFDSAGSGWPDAIFFPSNDDIAWATNSTSNYAADLTDLLPDVIEGYDPAVLSFCEIDGKIRCLRNDAAPDVFWYNKAFFDENGYSLPTTWEGYAELAAKIATEHPGKISGFLGDAYAVNRYLQGSGCPTNDRVSETEAHIDLGDPACVRATELLTEMYDAGALSTQGIFDGDAAEAGANLVMSPGAVWWGNYLFRDTWKIPAGQMSAVAPLAWEGESKPSTGNEGGGLWGVSSHITGKQLENALTFATFVATDPRWQVDLSVGLPGYGPLQQRWLDKQRKAGYLAEFDDAAAAFVLAATIVRPDRDYTRYNTGTVWTHTITPALTSGRSFTDAWSTFGDRLIREARTFGYAVQSTA